MNTIGAVNIYDRTCPVCKEDNILSSSVKKADPSKPIGNVMVLPCGHAVHVSCIHQSDRLSSRRVMKCFTCRHPIRRDWIPSARRQPLATVYATRYDEAPLHVRAVSRSLAALAITVSAVFAFTTVAAASIENTDVSVASLIGRAVVGAVTYAALSASVSAVADRFLIVWGATSGAILSIVLSHRRWMNAIKILISDSPIAAGAYMAGGGAALVLDVGALGTDVAAAMIHAAGMGGFHLGQLRPVRVLVGSLAVVQAIAARSVHRLRSCFFRRGL